MGDLRRLDPYMELIIIIIIIKFICIALKFNFKELFRSAYHRFTVHVKAIIE